MGIFVPKTPSIGQETPRADVNSLQGVFSRLRLALFRVLSEHAQAINDHTMSIDGPFPGREYTVAGLPSASAYQGHWINVTDETGGYTMAFSDGTNWRRVQDRAVVS